MNLAVFIAKRISFSAQRSFSRFIVRISIAATIISVAVMIITLAFAGGFQKIISEKIFSFFGHLRVTDYNTLDFSLAEEFPITKNDSVLRLGKLHPEISSVQAFATKNALLRTPDNIEGVLFKGVEPDHDFSHLKKFLLKGRWPQFPDSGYSQEIMLSESLAKIGRAHV